MSKQPTPINNLIIVGYASALTSAKVPRIVPPVFKFKDDTKALLPPFKVVSDFVLGGVVTHSDELQSLANQEKITLFKDSFSAKAASQLWIDETMSPNYAPARDVRKTLRAKANDLYESALVKFDTCAFEEASHLAGQALSANESLVEAWAVIVTIDRIQQQEDSAALMTRFAMAHARPETFQMIVDALMARVNTAKPKVEPIALPKARKIS